MRVTPPSCAAEGGRMDGLVSSAAPPQGQMVIDAVSLKLYISAFCCNLPCFAFWLLLLGNVLATCDIASNANADTTLNWHSEPELNNTGKWKPTLACPTLHPRYCSYRLRNWQTYRVESYYKLAVTNKPLLREVLLNIEQLHNTKNTFQKLTYPKSKICICRAAS